MTLLWLLWSYFLKIAHCIPCSKSTNASYGAKLISKDVVRLHGIPSTIVSHRDVKFVTYF